ncbi:uncharacterized protein HD556DRAFT_54859 [Suillus plorans]|uniref:Uncharacterized protein n=1 Tax=Suillus plorans TaxID=116603 RepID=A0A9P7E3U0_9AGAM|nr:uncharacterized protein HD556DRAFT_54859 [Suillus plorans]KAG1810457.1 hypothetical protein HD556DRAFT_54859 [Suillus plorans]
MRLELYVLSWKSQRTRRKDTTDIVISAEIATTSAWIIHIMATCNCPTLSCMVSVLRSLISGICLLAHPLLVSCALWKDIDLTARY